jgi:hypothetical protein
MIEVNWVFVDLLTVHKTGLDVPARLREFNKARGALISISLDKFC